MNKIKVAFAALLMAVLASPVSARDRWLTSLLSRVCVCASAARVGSGPAANASHNACARTRAHTVRDRTPGARLAFCPHPRSRPRLPREMAPLLGRPLRPRRSRAGTSSCSCAPLGWLCKRQQTPAIEHGAARTTGPSRGCPSWATSSEASRPAPSPRRPARNARSSPHVHGCRSGRRPPIGREPGRRKGSHFHVGGRVFHLGLRGGVLRRAGGPRAPRARPESHPRAGGRGAGESVGAHVCRSHWEHVFLVHAAVAPAGRERLRLNRVEWGECTHPPQFPLVACECPACAACF